MLNSIYIGLSGLAAYQKGLQTISNNVANLNTDGFKTAAVNFSDLTEQGSAGARLVASGSENSGNGVTLAAPLINFGQGDLRQTGGDLDLAIQGGGFLVLLDGDRTLYARTGQFVVDDKGYIIQQSTDRRLAVLDDLGRAVAVNVDSRRTRPPVATTTIKFSDNISSSATTASVANIAVYDSAGAKHSWTVKFDHATTAPAGEWTVSITDSDGRTIGTSTTLRFLGGTVDPSTAKLTVNDTPSGADPMTVTLDFSDNVTTFSTGTTSTIRTSSVDGNASGELSTTTVDDTGHIKLTYTNGETQLAGAIAIADFRNPQELERASNGAYTISANEQPTLHVSGEQVGKIVSKQIEASNVDLSQQFGDLILVQRGFQASSQVVSVSNDMIQQLFGIRGQN